MMDHATRLRLMLGPSGLSPMEKRAVEWALAEIEVLRREMRELRDEVERLREARRVRP